MSKRFLAILLAIIIVFGGAFYLAKHKNNSPGTSNVQPTNHIEGDGKKNVTLVEYGDYQCPACGQYYPLLKQVFDKYKSDIHFQFRNFPLVQIHKNAFLGARAAEAADKQGKFWEMHDLLYEQQQAWSESSDPTTFFASYAGQLGLNVDTFKADMASSNVNDLINADIQEGQKLGANSTPTFVLNGKKIDNPHSLDDFNKLIDNAISGKN